MCVPLRERVSFGICTVVHNTDTQLERTNGCGVKDSSSTRVDAAHSQPVPRAWVVWLVMCTHRSSRSSPSPFSLLFVAFVAVFLNVTMMQKKLGSVQFAEYYRGGRHLCSILAKQPMCST